MPTTISERDQAEHDRPRQQAGQQQRHGVDDPERNAVAELRRRRARALLLVAQDLDAIGVDRDVLRRREEGDEHRGGGG